MKIAEVRFYPLTAKYDQGSWTAHEYADAAQLTLVEVKTDDGISGYGEIAGGPQKTICDLGKLFGGLGGPQNLTFGYPDMCKFQIVLQQITAQGTASNTALAEVFGSGYCVIENVQVDYGSQNKMVFFTPEGTSGMYYPSEINLSIALRETSLPLAGDIQADHSHESRTIF